MNLKWRHIDRVLRNTDWSPRHDPISRRNPGHRPNDCLILHSFFSFLPSFLLSFIRSFFLSFFIYFFHSFFFEWLMTRLLVIQLAPKPAFSISRVSRVCFNDPVLSKQQRTCDRIRDNMKSLFSQQKKIFFEENKMLVRDQPANLKVTLTTIMDSYE